MSDEPARPEELEENLAAALGAAVPLRMQEIRAWTDEQRANDAAWVLELMRAGAAADVLLFGMKDGRPAAAFATLARGLAALAYVEGGVTVAGLHWCAEQHIECPNGPQWAHLGDVGVDIVSVENDLLGLAASPQAAGPVVDVPREERTAAPACGPAEPQDPPRYVFDGENGTRPRAETDAEPG